MPATSFAPALHAWVSNLVVQRSAFSKRSLAADFEMDFWAESGAGFFCTVESEWQRFGVGASACHGARME
jgi:hypothetical protein